MTNRILRSMLVIALLANQAAICGAAHSHHGSEPANHSARGHVHLSGHSHEHHDAGDHHHHCDDRNPAQGSAASFDSNLPVDHDSDAVYFGDQENLQYHSSRLIAKDLGSDAMPFLAKQPLVSKPTCRNVRARAGPVSTHPCAIYLQTSRLLI